MSEQTAYNLQVIRRLSKESKAGLLFSYKVLKHFKSDYNKALAYLKSDEFKNSMHIIRKDH